VSTAGNIFENLELGPNAAILDSCGITSAGSNLTIVASSPSQISQFAANETDSILECLENALSADIPCVFTLSYDVGIGINGLTSDSFQKTEPGLYIAAFPSVQIIDHESSNVESTKKNNGKVSVTPNFSRDQYLAAIEVVKEHIRDGTTYQTNLTQQLTVSIGDDLSAIDTFARLRERHPAPFLAYIDRGDSTVISASPELFFRVEGDRITTSPIKGTRPRGSTPDEDARLRYELATSQKDRAENTMIVDLLRNDLGRVCEFGSVEVDELCAIKEFPSLFHMESTISGKLRKDATVSDIIRALFPCGSITGAPKISTMRIIDDLEPSPRGLSMGCIGLYLPPGLVSNERIIETSVAIRTMVIRDNIATFNVGGGIVIDSDPAAEYAETLTKATALLDALGTNVSQVK